MEALMTALAYVLQPYHIGVIFFGTLIGILVGAMPGLSSIMGLSIMMPLTLSGGQRRYSDAAGHLLRRDLRRLHHRHSD